MSCPYGCGNPKCLVTISSVFKKPKKIKPKKITHDNHTAKISNKSIRN